MEFTSDRAIYLQIVDYVCEKIVQGEWKAENKIPSVRELSASLAVNPNTVARSYEVLEKNGIIYSQRGVGFSIHQTAFESVKKWLIGGFLQTELPYFLKKMRLLNLSWDEIQKQADQYEKK